MKNKQVFLIMMLAVLALPIYAQNKIGNNPALIHEGSLLELESLTKGLRLPRIPLNNVNQWTLDGTAASGMIIFNESGTEPKGIYYWSTDAAQWIRVVTKSELSTLIANYATQNTTVRDSIVKVINNTIVTGDIKGKDFTSNSPVLKVLNGTGAIIKGAQVDIDKDAFGHLLLTSPVSDSLSIAISKNSSVRDSIRSVVNNTIVAGDIKGKDFTSISPVLKVLNGTGAIITDAQIDIDKDAFGHLLRTSPVSDSLSIAISSNPSVRDSIRSVVNNTIVAGDIKGKDMTSNSAAIKILNGTAATIKDIQIDLDKNELGHFLNTAPLADSLSVAISKSTVIRDSITSVLKTKTTNTLAGASGKLTSTVNGVSTDLVPASGVVDKTLGFDASGNLVSQLIASGVTFNTDRAITLPGLSITGQNLGAGGKTMAQFFEAFFFPAVSATPPTSTLTTATTTYPYSIWKNWGNPPSSNVSFTWSVTNLSLTDNTDDKAITSIKLKSGATELATVTPTGGNQSGTFTGIPFGNTVLDPKTTFNKTYTLEVVDAQPNTVTKNLNLTMSPAIQLTYGAPTLTPVTLVYEYEDNDKDIALNWNITPNDESISSISVDGTLIGSPSTTGNQLVHLKTIANGGTQTKAFPLIVTGDIYGAGASKNSPTVSWANRLYRGTITSAVPPSDGTFTFTDNDVKTILTTENKLGGNWKATAGYDFVCGAGGQYVCFAYPDDATTPIVQYYDSNFSSWMTYSASDITIISRPNFMNQLGYNKTDYKLVFVNPEYFGQTVKIRIQ